LKVKCFKCPEEARNKIYDKDIWLCDTHYKDWINLRIRNYQRELEFLRPVQGKTEERKVQVSKLGGKAV